MERVAQDKLGRDAGQEPHVIRQRAKRALPEKITQKGASSWSNEANVKFQQMALFRLR